MTSECIRTFTGHTDLVRTIAFNSTRMISGSYDMSIKVWNINTGDLMLDILNAHTSWVFNVAFDGTRIVSSSQDKSIGIWNFGHDVDCLDEFM